MAYGKAVDGGEAGRAVVELDVLRAPTDVRGVHLELHVDHDAVTGRDLPEAEGEPAVAAPLLRGRGLDRVDVHGLEPPFVEDERGVPDPAPALDRETALVEEPAAETLRCAHLEAGDSTARARLAPDLAEDAQKRNEHDRGEEDEEDTTRGQLECVGRIPVCGRA